MSNSACSIYRDAFALQGKRHGLVEVALRRPPVCRIIDFGKFQYEAKKKANEAKKKQVTITVKEVKFRPGTDDHDYDYRMKHAREWLEEGDKVKATIWFRGREMTHRELGARILEKLEKDLIDVVSEHGRYEGPMLSSWSKRPRGSQSDHPSRAGISTTKGPESACLCGPHSGRPNGAAKSEAECEAYC